MEPPFEGRHNCSGDARLRVKDPVRYPCVSIHRRQTAFGPAPLRTIQHLSGGSFRVADGRRSRSAGGRILETASARSPVRHSIRARPRDHGIHFGGRSIPASQGSARPSSYLWHTAWRPSTRILKTVFICLRVHPSLNGAMMCNQSPWPSRHPCSVMGIIQEPSLRTPGILR